MNGGGQEAFPHLGAAAVGLYPCVLFCLVVFNEFFFNNSFTRENKPWLCVCGCAAKQRGGGLYGVGAPQSWGGWAIEGLGESCLGGGGVTASPWGWGLPQGLGINIPFNAVPAGAGGAAGAGDPKTSVPLLSAPLSCRWRPCARVGQPGPTPRTTTGGTTTRTWGRGCGSRMEAPQPPTPQSCAGGGRRDGARGVTGGGSQGQDTAAWGGGTPTLALSHTHAPWVILCPPGPVTLPGDPIRRPAMPYPSGPYFLSRPLAPLRQSARRPPSLGQSRPGRRVGAKFPAPPAPHFQVFTNPRRRSFPHRPTACPFPRYANPNNVPAGQ